MCWGLGQSHRLLPGTGGLQAFPWQAPFLQKLCLEMQTFLLIFVNFCEPQNHRRVSYKGGTAACMQTCSSILKLCGKGS